MAPGINFLPVSKADMKARGIEQLDFVFVSGDAYVDHPSFGVSIITRVIEAQGYTIGVIAQPDWHDPNSYLALGKPKYGFFVTSGNIDSMVAHYTVAKHRRTVDMYSPGGKMGLRPDRAATVYCRGIREVCPDTPIILGGLEASLRRFAHYDYWNDSVMPSVLVDSGADLLVFGMGENQMIQIANRLAAGERTETMTDIRGTCYLTDPVNTPWGAVQCPDHSIVSRDKKAYAKANGMQMREQDEVRGKKLIQRHGDKMLVQNEPMPALSTEELDWVYALPYMRYWHPMYEKEGGVPGIEEVQFSLTHNRGCFGGCNFCAIQFHQGRHIAVRSEDSIIEEAKELIKNPRFKGYIHDVGGPTANFRIPSCQKQNKVGMCPDRKCLAPHPCKALEVDHSEYLQILRHLRSLPGIKKVFIRSGLRYDYMLQDKDKEFFNELIEHHVSGQLKVAPEHCSAQVLENMGKPYIETFVEFSRMYFEKTKQLGKEQYLVPYLMSSHPGSTLADAVELAQFLKKMRIRPEQVQDFYPTPGTVSTCMYYTGLNPYTMEAVYAAKDPHEKALQRALLQYYQKEKQPLVIEALKKAGRADLIGTGPDCLVQPMPERRNAKKAEEQPKPVKKGTFDKNGVYRAQMSKPSPRGKTASSARPGARSAAKPAKKKR